MSFDLDNMKVTSKDEAKQEMATSGGSGRESRYEPVAEKWASLEDGKAIALSDLSNSDVQNLRNLLYNRFGKENVIVQSTKVGTDVDGEDTYDAVVREREGNEYLRDSGPSSENGESEPEKAGELDLSDEDEDIEDVF